jgi:hypothetical protein
MENLCKLWLVLHGEGVHGCGGRFRHLSKTNHKQRDSEQEGNAFQDFLHLFVYLNKFSNYTRRSLSDSWDIRRAQLSASIDHEINAVFESGNDINSPESCINDSFDFLVRCNNTALLVASNEKNTLLRPCIELFKVGQIVQENGH